MLSFESSYRQCYPSVLAYVRRRTDDNVAEDLCAEVFTRAWSGWPPRGDLALPWLYGIARNVVLEHYRQRQVSVPLDSVGEHNLQEPSAESRAAANVDIMRALGELGDNDREILTLHAWEGLTPAEIAVVLGISENSSRVRLHRARARLATCLHTTIGAKR
ncbi:RNA polymerase sigma factor [Corynebacterium liangguodongii]|uniref:Sigma-70 family RNA polymerase sigma factor n=1 Tax=Corynebacterium liangguodongii TaxID=2079535 RepID=A0A2S0WH79_9CORY|nr:RNA polymerase sigma factor [Corynebacterium liangguodongii]AWB85086.1 sigma-70 family RNA polymerase sigma factor [Corynebacterium liangguodongii]PWC00323.1 RNA polymerase sigma factor [Corynebacterium liangguodongii]